MQASRKDSWAPQPGDPCVITSVPHPSFQHDIGQKATFRRRVPDTRWVWIDIDWRSTTVRADGVRVIRIRKGSKPCRIEQLSPLAEA